MDHFHSRGYWFTHRWHFPNIGKLEICDRGFAIAGYYVASFS